MGQAEPLGCWVLFSGLKGRNVSNTESQAAMPWVKLFWTLLLFVLWKWKPIYYHPPNGLPTDLQQLGSGFSLTGRISIQVIFFPRFFSFKFSHIQIIQPPIKCTAHLACEMPRSVCQGWPSRSLWCHGTSQEDVHLVNLCRERAMGQNCAWSVRIIIPGLFFRGREEGSRLYSDSHNSPGSFSYRTPHQQGSLSSCGMWQWAVQVHWHTSRVAAEARKVKELFD